MTNIVGNQLSFYKVFYFYFVLILIKIINSVFDVL